MDIHLVISGALFLPLVALVLAALTTRGKRKR